MITPNLDDTQPELVETTPLSDTQPELVKKTLLDGTWQPELLESKYIDKQPLAKLTQNEKHLLSLSEAVIHGNESLWSLILSLSSKMLDQVAPTIMKIVGFAKLKQMKEHWYSEPFLAFNEGYQVCLKVYADGFCDGKGTHVSVYLHLMKGEHDDKLQQSGHWPMRGIFIIELLNQLSDKDHHSRKMAFITHSIYDDSTKRVVNGNMATTGYGLDQFISHDTLLHQNDNGYLKNDALYFRISYKQYVQKHKKQEKPLEKQVTKVGVLDLMALIIAFLLQFLCLQLIYYLNSFLV